MDIDIIEGMFYPAAPEVVGQIVHSGATTFSVPAGVTSISVVCVGAQLATDAAFASLLCSATRFSGNVGTGGNGGVIGTGLPGLTPYEGGGGAGGYSGNGGAGGGNAGQDGAGGGGGGGAYSAFNDGPGGTGRGVGGGVGLLGQGTSGAAGFWTSGEPSVQGSPGSGGSGTTYGGGIGAAGLPLRYVNNIAVTPGQVLYIRMDSNALGSSCAIRIMWGGGRSYPSNAGDM